MKYGLFVQLYLSPDLNYLMDPVMLSVSTSFADSESLGFRLGYCHLSIGLKFGEHLRYYEGSWLARYRTLDLSGHFQEKRDF